MLNTINIINNAEGKDLRIQNKPKIFNSSE